VADDLAGLAAGVGVPPHVGVVGGRVPPPPVGVAVRQGPVQRQDQRRGAVLVPGLPRAVWQRGHLQVESLQQDMMIQAAAGEWNATNSTLSLS